MAGSIIGALRVHLGIDTAAFDRGLKGAGKSAQGFGISMKTVAKGVAVAAAAVTAAIAGIAVAVRGTINEADKMGKMAQSIGVPVAELSRLKHAADLSGVSIDQLAVGMRTLSRNMNDVAQGGGKQAGQAFSRLGVSIKDAEGKLKSSSQTLEDIAERFRTMPDGATKTALAMQLFGKSGAAMIPMLNQGAAGIRRMKEEADALGIVIDEKTAKAAERFNDNLTVLGKVKAGVIMRITAGMLPAFEKLTERMLNSAKASDAYRIIGEGLGRVMVGLVNAFTLVLDVISALGRGFAYLASIFDTIKVAAFTAGTTMAFMFAPAIFAGIIAGFVAMKTAAVAAFTAITAAMMRNPFGALAVGITVAVTALYHFRDEVQKAIGVDVIGIIADAANKTVNFFRVAFESIKFIWDNLPAVMGAAAIGAANAVIGAIEKMLNEAVARLNGFISSVNYALSLLPDSVEVQIDLIGDIDVGRIKNDLAEGLVKPLEEHNARMDEIMASNPIGALNDALTLSTPAVQDFSTELGGAVVALEDLDAAADGAGGKTKAASEKMSAAAKAAKKEMSALAEEGKRVFEATRTPAEKLAAELENLDKLLKAGAISWDTYERAVKMAKDGMATVSAVMKEVGQAVETAFGRAFDSLVEGTFKAKEAVGSLLKDLGKLLANQAFKSLITGAFGGGTAGGSGLFGSLLGFAQGGSFKVGGTGGTDSQVVAFKATPGEHVDIRTPEQEGVKQTVRELLRETFGRGGKLPGFAQGGTFKVGGTGGIDSQLVAFKATPGERVDVSRPGDERGSGFVVNAPITIDARGAQRGTAEEIVAAAERRILPQILGVVRDAQSRRIPGFA